MANPVEVAVLAGAWTKVATAITVGKLRVLERGARKMLQTYRMTGVAAPTNRSEGATMSQGQRDFGIESTSPIDVYIWINDADGIVRVDR